MSDGENGRRNAETNSSPKLRLVYWRSKVQFIDVRICSIQVLEIISFQMFPDVNDIP